MKIANLWSEWSAALSHGMSATANAYRRFYQRLHARHNKHMRHLGR